MRARIVLSLAVAAGAAVALVSASGAATTKAQTATRIDVSTRAAVVHYLRSIHVSAKGVVIQRGALNYAGARCPGKGWTCAGTKHTVVQIAKRGGANRFVCRSSSCSVVQLSGVSRGIYAAGRTLQSAAAPTVNTAKCIKNTGLTQSCSITQTSSTTNNVAIVYENATSSSGLTQNASASASITQKATSSGANTACLYQNISLTNSTVGKKGTPVTVTAEAHQTATIRQDSLSGGNNAAQSATPTGGCSTGGAVTQTQTLTSVANGSGSITQNQNAAANGPNVYLDVEQNQSNGFLGSADGANNATFTQASSLSAVANSPAGPISQTQSSPDVGPSFSGLVGTLNQDSRDPSTAVVTQTETQCEDAARTGLTTCESNDGDAVDAPASLTQTQYGPEGVWKGPGDRSGRRRVPAVHKGYGTATQTGNGSDTFTITQSSKQDTDQGAGSNQTNTVQGDCNTSGTCSDTQTTTINGQTSTNTQTGSNFSTSTNCTGSNCTTTAPPAPSIDSNPPDPSNSSSAEFTFSDSQEGVTYLCDLDGGGYTACSSPQDYTGLADGSHTFSVKAHDPVNGNNSAPTSYTWTVALTTLTVSLNPLSDPEGGDCATGYASGTGFGGVPEEVPETVDLSQFDGRQVQIRFSFSTGDANYNAFEGWYVKNIQVTGMQSNSPVTVFSDTVTDGDTNFTASSDFGTTPGWHVTDRFGSPAWWYGDETTGTYQSNPTENSCTDGSANAGTITSPVITLASNSQLTFDTLWQIESVNPSTFDLMDVQVIPVG